MLPAREETDVDIDFLVNEIGNHYKLKKPSASSLSKFMTPKSTAKAIEFRICGNEKLKKALIHDALWSYTKSLASAEDDSEELALAYANRSAVLFMLKKYVPCLLDVNRALLSNCPSETKERLRDRRERCLGQIRSLNENSRIRGDETDPVVMNDLNVDTEWSELCNFGNPLISNASPKIKLDCDDKWGRYVKATKYIHPGEILSSQKFFSKMLLPSERYKNCSHCLVKCYALIPCSWCDQMMYCSKNCRAEAYNSYHRIECKLFSFTEIREFKEFKLMAIRTLLIGTEQGAQLQTLKQLLSIQDIFAVKTNPQGKLFVDDYLSVLRLCRTFNPSLLKWFTKFAVEVVIVLQELTAFFESDTEGRNLRETQQDYMSGAELFTTTLLVNHAVSLKYNWFSIHQMNSSDLQSPFNEIVIGAGVCALHNLINHSCDPNVFYIVRNRRHVLFSAKPIKPGEMIFGSYGQPFGFCPLDERRKILSQYEFTCECEACVNNWPLFADLKTHKIKFLVADRRKAIKTLKKIISPVLKENAENLRNGEILKIICDYRKWLHTNIKSPSLDSMQCEMLLLKLMMLMYADFCREYLTAVRDEGFLDTLLKSMINRIMSLCLR